MTKRILLLILSLTIVSSSFALSFGSKLPKKEEKSRSIRAKYIAVDNSFFSDDKLFANDQIDVSNIYPNPANDVVNLNYVILSPDIKAKITIRNVLGSVIAETELLPHVKQVSIQMNEYAAGLYFYTLSINNKSVITKKFLVKR
jgi:hypothetical protein